ncbi:MAG: MucBP domain-containing protein, partial [Clostridia bacterium]|nr:MucBP domain-containing protein [Clostridia bacterium]
MKKKKIIISVLVIGIFVAITGFVLAAPSINLSVATSGNTANLSWTNNDTVKSYNYDVKKSVNGGSYSSLTDNAGDKVTVLNVYCAADSNISFTTYDGENINILKSASLKRWMEEPNSTDSRGWGRGLIEVTPVYIDDFNANPSAYLKKVNGKYNYDVVVFGTWDGYSSQDISASAASVMNTYLAEGNSCVMGHDTIRGDGARAANFASLRSYFNIKTVLDDGVTGPGGVAIGNVNGGNTAATTSVTLKTNNVFTTYPWYIGSAGTKLTVPHCHGVQQVAYSSVEISFTDVADTTDQNGNGQWNYYLTVHNNCAMIQTGHSGGSATADEQKIWANLLFYLGDVNTSTSASDPNFKDINAPEVPTISKATLNGVNGNVTYTATDNGTTYKYYVEASERTTNEKTSSNTVTKVRTTGVAGYSYVIDTNATTTPDNTIDTTNTSINYTLGNGPKTYLHIKTIDGAGNVSGVTHLLLHTNVGPNMTLSQDITKWTNTDVVVTAKATDTDGTIVSILKPDNSTVNAATTTYTVAQNGTYTFTAKDNSGATVTKEIEITNIDKVKPEGQTTGITQPTETNRYATINFKATDDASGVAKIILPDGNEVTSDTTTYNVTTPGTYTFKVIDVAGNEREVPIPVTIVSDGLEVKFIDQVTKEEITLRQTRTGNIGDEYTTSPETVNGYELVLTPNNASGNLTMDKITVTYE